MEACISIKNVARSPQHLMEAKEHHLPNDAPQAMQQAWATYRRDVEDVRTLMLSQSWASDANARARIEYAVQEVQAAAYNLVIAPRPEYPSFYVHAAFQPIIYSYAMHASDFLYRRCFLDGRRTYRVWGKRNTSRFVDFQVINRFYGQADAKKIGNWDLDKFTIDADGSFEIIVGAEPRAGNWIRLDPSTGEQNYLNTREVFGNWTTEQGVDLHIERCDDLPSAPMELDEARLVDRLARAGKFVRFILDDWAVKLTNGILDNSGRNNIFLGSFAADQGAANNPSAIYPTAVWQVAPDEALILESEIPNAQFWSVQLGDICWRVLDYAYHQTSLNGIQAKLDPDGRFRAVVAHQDPGAWNWLDTMGNTDGILIFRFYRFDRAVTPNIRKVKLTELWNILPPGTPRADSSTRTAIQRERTAAIRARYGE